MLGSAPRRRLMPWRTTFFVRRSKPALCATFIDEIAEDEGRDKQPEYSRHQFQHVHSPAVSLSPQGQ
jgi:hypothetical protein